MTRCLVLIGLLVLVGNCAFGQTKPDSVAIRELLEKEAATWRSGDVKGHADCWQIRPYSRILVSTADGRTIDVPPSLIINPPATMTGGGGYALLTDLKTSIHGNGAWVSHNEESVTKDGTRTFTYEIRLLEKINGQWKLVGQSAHAYKPTN